MIAFVIRNYKAVIALTAAAIAIIVANILSPFFTAGATFILSTSTTKATVIEHTGKIQKLETAVYGMDAKFDLIQKSLSIIEDRNYQELKEARQRRQAEKQ